MMSASAGSASGGGRNVVFVGQVPETATEADLRALFGTYGGVVSVRLERRSDRKPFAHVQFECEENATGSVVLDGTVIKGFEESGPIRVGLVKSHKTETGSPIMIKCRFGVRLVDKATKIPVAVVLVGPQWPSNVGAVARLCNVFNIASPLIIVKPECDIHETEAQLAATHGQWYLDNALVCNALSEVRTHCGLLAAFSARKSKRRISSCATVADFTRNIALPLIQSPQNCTAPVALIFGRESDGLTKQELSDCDLIVTIPIQSPNPVLNLSHAVSIALYEVERNMHSEQCTTSTSNAAPPEQVNNTVALWSSLTTCDPRPNPSRAALHNILLRAAPSSEEMRAIMDALHALQAKSSKE
ncbi:RNA methyltransferase TrmH [Pelomyxa schiedti]|nr:RNA methyltransferase TrmH [Pelomyxa schiedti]